MYRKSSMKWKSVWRSWGQEVKSKRKVLPPVRSERNRGRRIGRGEWGNSGDDGAGVSRPGLAADHMTPVIALNPIVPIGTARGFRGPG